MQRRSSKLTTIVLAVLAPALTGAKPNIVLITADTLRADHLGTYGYFRNTSPAIDALAADGWVIERAVAPMATTLPSHTSILTSAYPARHGIFSNLQFYQQPVPTTGSFRTFAQMLKPLGYRTAAFTSSSPLSEASGIHAGFDRFEGPPRFEAEQQRADRLAADTADRALAWLETARPPFFLWVHFFDPHDPYQAPAPFDSQFANQDALTKFLVEHRFQRGDLVRAMDVANRYDGEVRYMDAHVGRVLDALKRRGLYDPALVVFTADHGEGLWQHRYMRHGIVWNEQLQVPLIFKFPAASDAPRGRSSALASLIDILPTIAAATGLELPTEQFDGINLVAGKREYALSEREFRLRFWEATVYTLTSADWKLHRYEDGPDQLYHLAADPHETRNVILAHPEVAARMQAEIERLVSRHRGRSPLQQVDHVPEEILDRLRALGYAE